MHPAPAHQSISVNASADRNLAMALGLGFTARECNARGIELSSYFCLRVLAGLTTNFSWVFLNQKEEISRNLGPQAFGKVMATYFTVH